MDYIKNFKLFEQEDNDMVDGFKVDKTYATYSGAKPNDYILDDPQKKAPTDKLESWRLGRIDDGAYTIHRAWKGKDGGYATVSRYNPGKRKAKVNKQPKYNPKGKNQPKGYRYAKKGLGKIFNPRGKPARGSITR